jgi:MEMO1 family protein
MTDQHTETLPKLRAIELHMQLHNGEQYVVLQDPLELSEQTLLLPEAVAPLLAFLDGERSAYEVAVAFSETFGVRIEASTVAEVVAALDACLLLENGRARAAVQAATGDFHRTATRPMTIAGAGYPGHAAELKTFLDGYLPSGNPVQKFSSNGHVKECAALLSPHIDYARGGYTYGEVWQAAAEAARRAEAVVIFATDHYGFDPFTLTRQNYATPYGVLPADPELTGALVDVLGEKAAFAGELRHRREHSVELVAVWLHHMRGGVTCPIVPILCGSLYQHIEEGISPAKHAQVAAVLEALRAQMAKRRILVLASGDLAHVGPAFRGKPLDTAARTALRAADEELLGHMAAGDAEGFFQAISAVQDANNVCGVMPIYLTLKLLAQTHSAVSGHVTGYASCPADATNTSAVTIAGMVFG